MDVSANLEVVRERIAKAAARSGRSPEAVTLIAVSKEMPVERIRLAIEAGVTVLGENRVQEAAAKIGALGRPVRWHLIGHLQTNKAKDAVALFDLIQSVDSVHLARELERRAAAAGKVVPILVQVNVGQEATKGGLAPEGLRAGLEAIADFSHLETQGLMAIPPIPEEPEASRPYFRQLRSLWEAARDWGIPRISMRHLSMGMSADYEVAIEEGATMVRVGTAIFGPRGKAGR